MSTTPLNPPVSGSTDVGYGQAQPASTAAAQPSTSTTPGAPAAPDSADLRLVIEDDKAAGTYVYKTINWVTGVVVCQLPRQEIIRMREATDYIAGAVIRAQA